ncbi:caspase family protein [Rhodoferax sp.]|uniref:caspase family protein n=1 Tax=Rhodoferax sp. TaxID=50421 RepID=UPI002769D72E|nr:caspase family protein [Rhodoferax sp.]
MTNTRRTLLKALSLVPGGLAANALATVARGDSSRLALVVGNNAYTSSPLDNATNDARAIAEVLQRAGFSVDLQLDTTRQSLIAAIDSFGKRVAGPGIDLALFYYAGHGVQIDWRNYLLPVDVAVSSADDIKDQCIDLGRLLSHLSKAKDRSHVVILDACRDNPFDAGYRPVQPGLSQFDAPPGSLLAYATAPGRVAADSGQGKHGLYTGHLLRELAAQETRLEDALKRVRLNVRLASRGRQIPWESTSLENDIFLFPASTKLSAEELEKLFEVELATWTRIKTSRNAEDWIAYLRQYPNGKFSEIAQTRLGHILARANQVQATAATAVIDTKATGVPFGVPSANPHSAGTYPLGRKFTVGDRAHYLMTDALTGVRITDYRHRVTRVDEDADRVEINHGRMILDTMGNPLKKGAVEFDPPLQTFPTELQLGKKWTAAFKRTEAGEVIHGAYDMKVVGRERLTVAAGQFDTFKIEGRGWNRTNNARLEMNLWVVPGLNFTVRHESSARDRTRIVVAERTDLVAFRQQG